MEIQRRIVARPQPRRAQCLHHQHSLRRSTSNGPNIGPRCLDRLDGCQPPIRLRWSPMQSDTSVSSDQSVATTARETAEHGPTPRIYHWLGATLGLLVLMYASCQIMTAIHEASH